MSYLPAIVLCLAGLLFGEALKLQANNKCTLVTFAPFTDSRPGVTDEDEPADPRFGYGYGSWPDQQTLSEASYSLFATAELARKHFNERDTSIVPELANLGDCPIQFSDPANGDTWYFDSAYSRSTAVDSLLSLPRIDREEGMCAIIAPRDPRSNEGVSVLSEQLGIPQVAYATIDQRLDRNDDFPQFVRLISVSGDFASIMALYVQRDVWRRDYVAVIYEPDYGEQFEDGFEDAEDDLGFETITESVSLGNNESIYSSLGEVKETGYRTIVLLVDQPKLVEEVAVVAEDLGLLGTGYVWLIAGAAVPPVMKSQQRYPVDSPTDKLLRGAALYSDYDPFVYNGEDDPFLKTWRNQGTSLVRRVNSVIPKDTTTNQTFFQAGDDYFQTVTPTEYAGFLYDAVIATGIGACNAYQGGARGNHREAILNQRFSGATGTVNFKYNEEHGKNTTSRDTRGPMFGVYNVRPGAVGSDGMRGYEHVLTALYSHSYTTNKYGETVDGGWREVPGEQHLFYDMTNEEPLPKRSVSDEHFLSYGSHVAGLFLSSLAIFFALSTGLWVAVHRNVNIVKAAQPEFLGILCFGSALVASSLIFISFDESFGVSDETLDAMCSAWPWFFVTGYLITYCALFSKLWRLSQLLQMRRRAVRIKQVLWPFCLIIAGSMIVLIVWQVVDPLTWHRVKINGDPLETYGQCESINYGVIPFIIPLGFLFAVIIVMTAVIAWKLKDVQDDLAESKWIFFGIFTHIQTWLIGIPIIVITTNVSRNASYIMYAALTFIFSSTLVGLVIWPKIYVQVRDRYFGGPPKKSVTLSVQTKGMTRVSGLHTGSNSLPSYDGSNHSGTNLNTRVQELEQQVKLLQKQLEEKASEVPRGEVSEQHSSQLESLHESHEEDEA